MILDEPASGLDPLSRRNLKQTLRTIADGGATVVVSSHILSELAELSTSLGIMNQGKLLIQGTADHIQDTLGSAQKTLSFRFLEDATAAMQWLEGREAVSKLSASGNRLDCDFDGSNEDQAALIEALISNGFLFRTVEEKQNSFEEILTRIAEGNT
ncbi:MAG: hypothetical protein ACPGN3_16385 [Opitutales bacterium]